VRAYERRLGRFDPGEYTWARPRQTDAPADSAAALA